MMQHVMQLLSFNSTLQHLEPRQDIRITTCVKTNIRGCFPRDDVSVGFNNGTAGNENGAAVGAAVYENGVVVNEN